MKYPLEIYINGVEVDQFSDESVTIKKSVKSFKDIKKLFTEFSKTFSIPTSKKNNKLFKHVYRVDTTAVDSRVLIPATLKLNGVDFKSGNVSVEGTQFKDGKPYAYKVRFYGKLTELNKLIGQDELTDLDFSSLDIDNPNFSSLFSDRTSTSPVKFPLVCRSGRYIAHSGDFDFASTEGLTNTKNIRYSSTFRSPDHYGLVDNDLIGALRVKNILDAIESKYGLTISGAMRANYVEDLHLILQKTDQTTIEGASAKTDYNIHNLSGSVNSESTLTSTSITVGLPSGDSFTDYDFKLRFKLVTTASNFDGEILINGSVGRTVNTSNTYSTYVSASEGSVITFRVSTAETATFTLTSQVVVTETEVDPFDGETYISEDTYTVSGSVGTVAGGTGAYNITPNLPEMKVSDFLGDMFKRFNIVAQVADDLTVNTYHYDYYINQGNEHNVSQYVDISDYNINRPNYYSGVKFTGAEKKTILEHGFSKVNARKFGELKYLPQSEGNVIDGSVYSVDIKSHLMPVENLTDLNDASLSDLNVITLTDKDGTEQVCKPVFTYLDRAGFSDPVAYDIGTSVTSKVNYWMPSVIYTENTISSTLGIVGGYFGSEFNESGEDTYSNLGLFNLLWKNTISLTFDENKRRASYTAYLPLRLVKDIEPNDTLIIHNSRHLIESIETNYLTGESRLELILITEEDKSLFDTTTVVNSTGSTDRFVILQPSTGILDNVSISNGGSDTSVGGLLAQIN